MWILGRVGGHKFLARPMIEIPLCLGLSVSNIRGEGETKIQACVDEVDRGSPQRDPQALLMLSGFIRRNQLSIDPQYRAAAGIF